MKSRREISDKAIEISKKYPILTITGPRQSGKSTLARSLFPDKPYISFENADARARASDDPNKFLADLSQGAILDEVQKAPDILSYLQTETDLRDQPGRFILTGSAQLPMLAKVSQTLAGRTALLTLLPFSLSEAYPEGISVGLQEVLYRGFYPRIFDKDLNPTEALADYCATYVERDVRDVLEIKNLSKFSLFLKGCAARTGQILNVASLANDLGITHATAESWFSVMEASYLLFRIQPHFNSLTKRLMKSPKLHFFDCGLASYLMQAADPDVWRHHPLRGELFESFVAAELLKQRHNRKLPQNLYYWRDNTGHEIDILMDFGSVQLPIEVKSGQTVTEDMFKNLRFYQKLNPAAPKSVLVYGGQETYITGNTWVLGFRDLPRLAALDHRLSFPT